jgi:competence protein ComEA
MQRPIQSFLLAIVGSLLVTQIPWHPSAGENRGSPHLHGDEIAVLVDVNQAAHRELALLPNVGSILAKRIVADRSEHGPYLSLEDLERVHGIGEKTLQHLSRYCVASEVSSSFNR